MREWSKRDESGRSTKVKVNGPKIVGGQEGMKVNGPKIRGRSRRDESGRPSKCVGNQKGVRADGPRIRGRPRRDESGQSQNTRVVKKG